ncbi:MAG: hypothetical protein KJO00_10095 [Bacteroidia bacterium]|nr:hypothetical protein [Bacteroidia bacterium]NNK72201.1 hypothetical protein [Flavobacteriaceae bacterium]
MRTHLHYILFPLYFLCLIWSTSFTDDQPSELRYLSAQELSDFDYSVYGIKEMFEAFDIGRSLSHDALRDSNREKGVVLLAALARQIATDIEQGEIDPNGSDVRRLLKGFAEEDYYIHQPTVSRFIKLMTYLCNDDYGHVLKRYRESSFFVPSLIAAVAAFIFVILNALGRINWLYKNRFNRLVVILLIIGILVILVFKASCETNIDQYYFYGIPM